MPSSWDRWRELFSEAGYAPLTPDWPDDPETVEEVRANPDILAKKTLKQIADHTTELINALDQKPAVMEHSTGGLLAQMLAVVTTAALLGRRGGRFLSSRIRRFRRGLVPPPAA